MNSKECKGTLDYLYGIKKQLKKEITADLKEVLLSGNRERISEIIYNTIDYINDITY